MTPLIFDRLSETAARFPERLALSCDAAELSFAQAETLSNQVAHLLLELQRERGQRVGIALAKCNEYVCIQYGSLKAGCAYVPIDADFPLKRMFQIVEDCQIGVLFAGAALCQQIAAHPDRPAALQHLVRLKPDSPEQEPAASNARGLRIHPFEGVSSLPQRRPQQNQAIESDLAYVMYTSGSTGRPKGVMINHRNILTYVDWCVSEFSLTPEDAMVNVAPFTFDISGIEIFGMAASGATMVISVDQRRITTILSAIQSHRASFMSTVPTVLGTLVNNPRVFQRYDLSSLQTIASGAAVITPSVAKRLCEALPTLKRLCNLYGPTEATIYALIQDIRAEEIDLGQPIPIGRPIANTEAYVADEEGRPVPVGQEGELVLRGPHVALGYFNDAQKTAAAFRPFVPLPHLNETVYHTGDLARCDAQGVFHFLGRKDDMIKSRGYRIELNEIDLALSRETGLAEFVVVAIADELIENRICAAVVKKSGSETIDVEGLKSALAQRVPGYMVPDEVHIFDELPKTSSGKISKPRVIEAIQAKTSSPSA